MLARVLVLGALVGAGGACTAILGISEPGGGGVPDDAGPGVADADTTADAGPPFALSFDGPPLRALRGGTTPRVVRVMRTDGFTGPVQVSLLQLPALVAMDPASIPAGMDATNVGIDVELGAALGPATVRLRGEGGGHVYDQPIGLMIADEPGTPDESFGPAGSGMVHFVPPEGPVGSPRAIAVQADGKLLVGGDGGWVIRLLPDGELDQDFGAQGVLQTGDDGVFGLGLAGDAIVTGGTFFGMGLDELQVRLRRFDQAGVPELGFDGDGVVEIDGLVGVALAVDDLGNTLLGTTNMVATFTVRRYQDDGTRDLLFASNGTYLGPPMSNVGAINARPDLSFVVTGNAASFEAGLLVQSLDSAGDPVPTFGTNGVLIFGADAAAGTHAAFEAGGGLVVAGVLRPGGGQSTFQALLGRVGADGLPDTSFGAAVGGVDGVVTFPPSSGGSEARGLALAADGRIVLAFTDNLTRAGVGPKRMSGIERRHPNGLVDVSFERVQLGDGLAEELEITAIALTADGRIVVIGVHEAMGWFVLRVWD